MSYQDFGNGGHSSSAEKLSRLRFDIISPGSSKPLAGLSILDIGCNEGFFCIEALKLGASRVVGIDQDAKAIASARSRCPQGEFQVASWWELPNERFDVILFLSAIHYERDQKSLLQLLLQHLEPNGTLILECGVAPGNEHAWHTVNRSLGPTRFPTEPLLLDHLLSEFAARKVGQSVSQRGDPLPRFVYHCTQHQPTALLIPGSSYRGKTVLRRDLARRGIPSFGTDEIMLALFFDPNAHWRPISEFLRAAFKPEEVGRRLNKVGEAIAQSDHLKEFISLLADSAPAEAGMFAIEGDVLRYPPVLPELMDALQRRHIRSWVVSDGGQQ